MRTRPMTITRWALTLGLSLFLFAGLPGNAVAADETAAVEQAPAQETPASPSVEDAISVVCQKIFYKPLSKFFVPVNDLLCRLPDKAASVCGVGLFISAMIWVGLLLNPKYVNRGRPYKSIWTDLRLWTVISMTPHVLVYFYFT